MKNSIAMKKYILAISSSLIALTLNAASVWHDPMDAKIPNIHGRAWNAEIGGKYDRMPLRWQEKASASVRELSHHTAGLYVRFKTDSPCISVKYLLGGGMANYANINPQCHSGVDLYAIDGKGREHWVANCMKWRFGRTAKDTSTVRFTEIDYKAFGGGVMTFDLYLPTYNSITMMKIGVEEDAHFEFVEPDTERPIVVYGTSIAQGASASRPALTWGARLQRELRVPVYNLGFSGSAKMEPEMFDMLSEIDARVFIIDCIPNSHGHSDSTFVARFTYGIRKIRSASDAPIIIMDSNAPCTAQLQTESYRQSHHLDELQAKTIKELSRSGIKKLYHISNERLGTHESDLVEAYHPTDSGMEKYAKAYMKVLKRLLN